MKQNAKTQRKTYRSTARRVTVLAMMTAAGVVIGFICKNYCTFAMYYRFTLENLGVLISGIFFGPAAGAAVGLATDVISCLLSTNPAVNPVITAGAVTVGIISGAVPRIWKNGSRGAVYAVSVALSHLVGQVIIKSIGKMITFGMPWYGIFIGLAFSAVAGTIEYSVIMMLAKNKQISRFIENR